MSETAELPLFVHWEKLTVDLFERTGKFPRAIRATLTHRIEATALDVLEGLVTARYQSGREKATTLRGLDTTLTRLRVLVRLAHTCGHLPHAGYEEVSRRLDEAGRMLGGWQRGAAPPAQPPRAEPAS